MDGGYISIGELCKRWGVCYKTALRLVQGGKLQAFKIGRSYRIAESSITDYEPARGIVPRADAVRLTRSADIIRIY